MNDELVTFLRKRLNEAELGVSFTARAFREIEAKRRIVNTYEEARVYYDANKTAPAGEVHGLRTAVAFLAWPYADHADYREEWRP